MSKEPPDKETSHALHVEVSPASSAKISVRNQADTNQADSNPVAATSEITVPETDTVEEKVQQRRRQQETTMHATNPASPVDLIFTHQPSTDAGPSPVALRRNSTGVDKSSVASFFSPIMRSGSAEEPELQPEVPSASSPPSGATPAAPLAEEANSSTVQAQISSASATTTEAEDTKGTADADAPAENQERGEGSAGRQHATDDAGAGAENPPAAAAAAAAASSVAAANASESSSPFTTEQRRDNAPEAAATALADRGSQVDTVAVAQAAATAITTATPSMPSSSTDTDTGGAKQRKSASKPKPSPPSSNNNNDNSQTSGRWTRQEHEDFLAGLQIHGREWKKVAQRIPTRTSAQIRSHAQKYFAKLAREEEQQQAAAAAAAVHGQHHPHMLGIEDPSASSSSLQAHPAAAPPPLSTSARSKAERILENPTGVRREVEATLAALRERYEQLQSRLESQLERRQRGDGGSDGGGGGVGEVGPIQAEERARVLQAVAAEAPTMRRKRTAEEMIMPSILAPAANGPANAEETDRVPPPTDVRILSHREFGNGELIALSVLGGSLPRSGSGENLDAEASAAAAADGSDSGAVSPPAAPVPAAADVADGGGSPGNSQNRRSTEMAENEDESRTSERGGSSKRHRPAQ